MRWFRNIFFGESALMQAPRLKKLAERVTLLETADSGYVTPKILYKGKRKKKDAESFDCTGPCKVFGRKMGMCAALNNCCSPL